MNILMLGPWLPTTRRPLANERLHQFARHLSKEHRLTLACATLHKRFHRLGTTANSRSSNCSRKADTAATGFG